MKNPPARGRAHRDTRSRGEECPTVSRNHGYLKNTKKIRTSDKRQMRSKKGDKLSEPQTHLDRGRSRDKLSEPQTHLDRGRSRDIPEQRDNDFPEAQEIRYPDSEEDDSMQSPTRPASGYAGKTLLANCKKRSLSDGASNARIRPVSQKRPRDTETIIPDTDDQDRSDGEEIPVNSPKEIPYSKVGNEERSKLGPPAPPTVSGTFLKNFVGRITDQLANKNVSHLQEVNNTLEKLVAQVASLEREISELKAVSSACTIPRSGSCAKETGTTTWKRSLDVATPLLTYSFDERSQSKVLASYLCRYLTVDLIDGAEQPTVRGAQCLLAIMFGLRKEMTKSSFSDGEGKLHADFRYAYVLNLIFCVQRNLFGRFEQQHIVLTPSTLSQVTDAPHDADPRTSESSRGRISTNEGGASSKTGVIQPNWLRTQFIKVDDLQKARSAAESVKATKRDPAKDTPTDRDIAVHGCKRIYATITSSLHRWRAAAKVLFFEDFGYLAANWAPFDSGVDKGSFSMRWAYEEGKDSDQILSSVPLARMCKDGDDETFQCNRKLWRNLCRDCRDMIILVTHDVVVGRGNSVRKGKTGGTVRQIRRAINLVEVAGGFLTRYAQLPSIEDFIGRSEDSMRAIFVVAVTFRSMASQMVWDAKIATSAIKCEALSIEKLLPSPSAQERSANSRLLRMSQAQYEELNLPEIAAVSHTNASQPDYDETDGGEGNPGQDIDPSQGLDLCIL